jgi:D-alanyl-D-alanine carboxypeptidase
LVDCVRGSCVYFCGVALPRRLHRPPPQPCKERAPKKDATKKDEPTIGAPHAILIEAQYGAVLFERDADKMIFPASLAKLMTAEYVFNELKQSRLNLTDEFMVSENAWRKGGAPRTAPPCSRRSTARSPSTT